MKDKLKNFPYYKLLRRIGHGGYGEVYLAQTDNGKFVAIKFILLNNAKREINALKQYEKLKLVCNLVEILDSGEFQDYMYYVMPLADTLDVSEQFAPTDFRWQEKSLNKMIEAKLNSPKNEWFSVEEIISYILPIFDTVIALGEHSVLHRDIKPDNILFFNGKATLSDFGLLESDRRSISNVGTPLYLAPSWYINKGGNPDTYGLATSMYTLITGNLPDTIGRQAYRFPEKIIDTISDADKQQWLHWHRCIMRAIAENPSERFLTIQDFRNAIVSTDFSMSLNFVKSVDTPKKSFKSVIYAGIATIGIAVVGILASVVSTYLLSQKDANVQEIEVSSTKSTATQKQELLSDEFFKTVSEKGFYNSATKIKIDSFEDWKTKYFDNAKSYENEYLQKKELAEKTDAQIDIEIENEMQQTIQSWQHKEQIHKRNPKLSAKDIEKLKKQFYDVYVYPSIKSLKKEKYYLRNNAQNSLFRAYDSYVLISDNAKKYTTMKNYRKYVEYEYAKHLDTQKVVDLYKKNEKR